MNSKENQIRSCRNLIEAKVHQPLQIRTYKHRCFIFCPGHTSLTCVPGIGKKNESRLNRIGINDLSHLFSKYRQINEIQHFQQWLENHVGFSSYQAKMTTCALAAKLGDIHEINTGLKPICCPTKERRKDFSLSIDDDELTNVSPMSILDDMAAIKGDDLHSVPIVDRSINSMEKIFPNSKSSRKEINAQDVSLSPTDRLTGVKSPNDEVHATLPSTRKKTNNRFNIDNEEKTNLSSEKTRIQFEDPIETIQSLKLDNKDMTPLKNNPDNLISKTEMSETSNDFSILTRRTNMDDHLNAIVPHSTDEIVTNQRQKDVIDSPLTERSSTNSLRSKIDSSSSINAGNSDRKTHQTSNHPNLNESIHSTSSFLNNSPKKSILRTTESKSRADFSADAILATIKEDQTKATDRNKIDSASRAKMNDNLSIAESNSRSISSLKRFYASLPLSTPATFPIKRKISTNNETSSSSMSNTRKNATNRTSAADSPSNISTTDVSSVTAENFSMKSKFLDPQSVRMGTGKLHSDAMIEQVVLDPNANLDREIDKIVNLIMEQALTIIAKDQGHPSQMNVTTLKKNDTSNAPPSTTSLAERFAQVEAKKLATFDALNKETYRSRLDEKNVDSRDSRRKDDELQCDQQINDRRQLNKENLSTPISSDNNVTSERFSSREKEKKSNDSMKNSKIDESNWKIFPRASHDKTDMMTTFGPTEKNSLRSDYKLENALWNDSSRSQSPSTDSSVWNSFDVSKNPNDLKRRMNEKASASSVIKSHIDQHDNDDHPQEKSREIIKANDSKQKLDSTSKSTLSIDINQRSNNDVPSTPALCIALWNQISDEEILSKRRNLRILSSQINSTKTFNENRQSSLTMFEMNRNDDKSREKIDDQ